MLIFKTYLFRKFANLKLMSEGAFEQRLNVEFYNFWITLYFLTEVSSDHLPDLYNIDPLQELP